MHLATSPATLEEPVYQIWLRDP
eukprot:COSAG01_NODE_15149_length_1368_cov_1.794326_1_plen_22_part_10